MQEWATSNFDATVPMIAPDDVPFYSLVALFNAVGGMINKVSKQLYHAVVTHIPFMFRTYTLCSLEPM